MSYAKRGEKMDKYVTRVRTGDGDLPIDYNALANLPRPDTTLTKSGSFADAYATGQAIKALEDFMVDISSSNDTLKSTVNDLNTSVDALGVIVDDLGASVTGLDAATASLNDDVSQIEENMALKADQTSVDHLSESVDTINNTVSEHSSAITEHSSQIESISNRITPITHGGTGATTAIAALKNLGVIYSDSEPSDPVVGMIWMKPVS